MVELEVEAQAFTAAVEVVVLTQQVLLELEQEVEQGVTVAQEYHHLFLDLL